MPCHAVPLNDRPPRPALWRTVTDEPISWGDWFRQFDKSNLALLVRYQLDPIGSRRSSRWFVFGFSTLLALAVIALIALPVLLVVALVKTVGG